MVSLQQVWVLCYRSIITVYEDVDVILKNSHKIDSD